MKKKDNTNRKQALAKKSALEALQFQTHFGLKQRELEDNHNIQDLVDAEMGCIAELDLVEDILDIKKMVEGVRAGLSVELAPEKGDFSQSIVAIALKIANVPCLENLQASVNWQDLVNQKLLTIYFPADRRNEVVDCLKKNGYNTSTYLGQPMVKFRKLYIIIKRDAA